MEETQMFGMGSEENEGIDPHLWKAFAEYLCGIGPALLISLANDGAAHQVMVALQNAFSTTSCVESVQKFLLSAECSAFLVELVGDEVFFSVEIKQLPASNVKSSFSLIKTRDLPIDMNRPIPPQVQVVSLLFEVQNADQSAEALQNVYLLNMHQVTKHLLAPLARSIKQPGHELGEAAVDESDQFLMLHKRIRDLDFTLEQCQRGSAIPSISLAVPLVLQEVAKKTTATVLRTNIERYNASQADILLQELGVNDAMGDTQNSRDAFSNEVNKMAKQWPTELQRQTRLVDTPFAGTVEKEITFWKDLDRKLNETKEQLDSAPVLLTKLVLKRTNRVSEQLISEAESSLDRSIKSVAVSLAFLRDYPINELQGATVLHPKLSRAITNCLTHFGKLKHSTYEFSRAIRLLEVLGHNVIVKVVTILRERNVMQCSIDELRSLKQQFEEVLLTWKTNFNIQVTTLKDVAKRRNESFTKPKFDFELLHARVAHIVDFREQHEKMLNILSHVLVGREGEFLSELSEAYQMVVVTNTDLFDLSSNGATMWSTSASHYEKRLERIEERITRILDERLHAAKSADEMFRIFALFNPLFFRPSIRNAVNSFRATLMKSVREDVKRLQDKFKVRYDESQEKVTSELRDIPPLSGRIIWARQIENQLSMLMKRIQDVLGVGWEDHIEGKQLKEVCDELRSYLDTNQIFEDWIAAQLRTDSSKYSKVKDFLLLVDEDPRTAQKQLKVNFDQKQVVVHKEVKYLEWLLPSMSVAHKSIPNTIQTRSLEAYNRYPVALALESALASYHSAKSKINAANAPLLVAHMQAVRDVIKEALGGSKRSKWVKWDSSELLNEWVSLLVSKIYNLQERVDDVNDKIKAIDKLLIELTHCEYDRAAMEALLVSIQAVVDELPMKGLSNVVLWVGQLDNRIEGILVDKLRLAVDSWCATFGADFNDLETRSGATKTISFSENNTATKKIEMDAFFHEIILSNQLLSVQPSLEHTKRNVFAEYHKFLAMSATLPRLIAQRFQVFAEASTAAKDYSNILQVVGVEVLKKPYLLVELKLQKAKEHVAAWLQYQTLWDSSVGAVTDQLEKDLTLWQQFLMDIRTARASVDSVVDELSFGAIVVNHRAAQNKINLKYDTWQKECQARFGVLLLQEIKSIHTETVSIKTKLESLSLEGTTKDAIMAVEYILKSKARVAELDVQVNNLKSSEKVLQTQRFSFPSDWLPVSNVSGAYDDMCNILERRITAMNSQLHALQQKIKEEDVVVNARAEQFMENWNLHKPVEGKIVATAALETISMYTAQLSKLLEDFVRLRGAKDSLHMDYVSDDRLSFVESEMNDLKEAWVAIAPISDKLTALGATPMKDVNPTILRKQLEELMNELKTVPAKVRSYAAVETVLERIQKYLSFQPVLRDICTDALKERHWKVLLDKIGLKQAVRGLTIAMIWESHAMQHRKAIQEVLATAQGELALEQFLHDLRDHWIARELTVSSRDNAKIIVGWESLFSTLEDNLISLASIKQSPYFRNVPEFQEDSVNWETRLTNLRGIFEVWVEVQRKWIYLRGIFRNADIKAQLPAQFSKFKIIDNEYSSLMKRVATKPVVLDVLQFDNLHRQLEREDSTMTLIQKALGEYLEKQRQIFPRFYFVNNDDLIEIIGNSNEPTKIMVHLGKMFAAINSLGTNFEAGIDVADLAAHAMISKEGEVVAFNQPIALSVGVKDWLASLQLEMSTTLAILLEQSSEKLGSCNNTGLLQWMTQYPAQVSVLSSQLFWTRLVEESISSAPAGAARALSKVLELLDSRLQTLSLSVLQDMDPDLRRKCEQLLTEMVHQRDVLRLLLQNQVCSSTDFGWLYHLRFYWNPKESDLVHRLRIKMSNASFNYGFEYLGVGERLVQTPLTDRCYLTLTQALHFRMGANPFGPAGTGKTESVKMLGSQLGRFVLVFNCDSSFDYAAMGRIFSGLCETGSWGCFDEFNRLEERILSAVSQQILTIQRGLMTNQTQIDLMGAPCKLSKDVGIFVTLNPGYAGRSNLPDNLKQLFRAVAMSVPDRKLIAQVMLFAQGIATAEDLAGKIVLLFVLCEEQLSAQSHYDFGLRALKSVLVGAGELKRKALAQSASATEDSKENLEEMEMKVLIKSACDSVLPKLVAEDIPLFLSLLAAVFPGCVLPVPEDKLLLDTVKQICVEESLETTDSFLEKVLQLKQVQDIRHGIMLVGPSGAGKTSTWRTLLKALGKLDGVKGDAFVIDPKSIKKEKLFGSLDANTLEWTDGIFTKILRKLADPSNVRNNANRRAWIVFDGDVDPEWAENLNSVLDDNKVLTLPSGDRLKIPPNVRIVLEVDNLQYATLATVSRCGMIWFAKDTITLEMSFKHQLGKLAKQEMRALDGSAFNGLSKELAAETQSKFVEIVSPYFLHAPAVVETALRFSLRETHIMEPTVGRLLETLFSMLARGIALCFEYNESNGDFPMAEAHMEGFASKWLFFSIIWSFGSSLSIEKRTALGRLLEEHCNTNSAGKSVIDLQPNVQDGEWLDWSALVPRMEIESHRVSSSDVVITTTDTVRHAEVMRAWLLSRKPLVLCGPPGSGKTMTLTAVLENIPEFILASLNFSSGTTPELILKTFAQYCEVVDSPDGLVLQPNRQSYRDNQWLVVFCDEINLPATDAYGTQRVIMFLRQLTEQGGYWNADCKWVHLKRIQFVGACNPPTDAGRTEMSQRFLRHAPVLLVDYPAESSLKQIYRCFNAALLRMHPALRGFVDPVNDAMVELYLKNKERFTADMAPQYVYSPRELSRWVRALYEAMEPLDTMSAEELVRLWAHEALRLFQDRIVDAQDREWCGAAVDAVAMRHFPGVDVTECLKRPILFSQWIRKTYQSTDREVLREFVAARLKVFYEEELDVPLVIFDEVLDHVLRIDNVLRHPMGHLLLVGESGTGKTVLTKFVAWMNGLAIFQIKANNRYTLEQFDDDLRALLRRVGVDGEKICFIFDESNALSSAFLERMNALLASGEIPGLFEGEERVQLMSACRESFNQREGLVLDSEDELYRRFTKMIQRNLHVVFTMNPSSSEFDNRCTTSPALFNRCVVDWFGTWSTAALAQVAEEFTRRIDTGYTAYSAPCNAHGVASNETLRVVQAVLGVETLSLSEAIVSALVSMHESAKQTVLRVGKSSGRQHYLSPRDFLDLIHKLLAIEEEKRSALEDQQTHVRTGLQKLLETQDQVAELNKDLHAKSEILKTKDLEANNKLSQMVEKQNEAEQRKAVAETLTVELQQQTEQIAIRKDTVERELSEAEPALISAKQSVQNIRKAQLDEVRGLVRPPKAVQLTMEMVCTMMGESSLDWAEIRKVIRRDDFIATVVNFDPLSLTPKQIKTVQDAYLANAELDYASVDRASKACGPLYQWAASQIKYATILKRIKPLRDEMLALQEKSQELTVQQKRAVEEVEQLESAIKTYKSEYAAAIRETEIVRGEMESVTKRVSRANSLLSSLQEEKVRWEATALSFDQQMSTLVGDCLLSCAFLTYAGIFDHKARARLQLEWSETMESLRIPFRAELDMINYLSRPTDQLAWVEAGLPNDALAIQNAILLERFRRFPLVIDPSGQATKFLLCKYAAQKIVTTSFLDASFMKTLASAIRFGTPLLVQDVESIDPVLNPVLNRELQRTGGRTLIRLGSEDIDFSPKFMVILLTRNPFAKFAPDLCSRVTTVNFTITPASLESQVLSEILKSERPDVDKRRSDVLRLQGEQNAKLRELQDTLLDKISAVQGAILDDDSLIHTLEGIKAEARTLHGEVSRTAETLEEVKAVSSVYNALAAAVASVYFTLESLAEVNALYQYSLQFFLNIIGSVLRCVSTTPSSSANSNSANNAARVKALKGAFFNEIVRRVLPGLTYEDKLVFLVRAAQIATQDSPQLELSNAETDFLTKGSTAVDASAALLAKYKAALPGESGALSDAQAKQLLGLGLLPAFASLLSSFASQAEAWARVLHCAEPEKALPLDWIPAPQSTHPERVALLKALVVRALRPERVLIALEDYVSAVFSALDFEWREHRNFDLREVVEKDSHAAVPLMLCSQHGQDASSKVDALSSVLDKRLLQVSMGSAEGFAEAEKIIAQASKTGSWVLLRNVHLCTDWLAFLEKKLFGLSFHESFRLFLTCEIHEKLPTALLRRSEVLLFESSSGMKVNLQRFFMNIPSSRIDRQPTERARLYGLLAWFNAVLQERLRYAPLGWTKKYEFSDSDLACSLDVIDQWVSDVAGQRVHVDPAQLPWQALRTLLSESLYGGRVDHNFDQLALDAFVQSIFSAHNYDAGAVLVRDDRGEPLVSLPDSLTRSAFEAWIKSLPDSNPPSWIGLPTTAERQLKRIVAQKALSHLAIVNGLAEIDSDGAGALSGAAAAEAHLPQKKQLQDTLSHWLQLLAGDNTAQQIDQVVGSLSASSTVLGRTLFREAVRAKNVLQVVSQDLLVMRSYASGETKLTNAVRDLLSFYKTGVVPHHWKTLYVTSHNMPLALWIEDLVARVEHVLGYKSDCLSLGTSHVFGIGRMFSPEAFILATRQSTAQANKWSLEDLELYLDIDGDKLHESCAFDTAVRGLVLQGAQWDETRQSLVFSDDLRCALPECKLKWRLKSAEGAVVHTTSIPAYINENRKQLVTQVLMSTPADVTSAQWMQRSVALVLQTPIV